MADEKFLETGNVCLGNNEQPAPMRYEVMVGEDDGSAFVPVEEDLGFHAVQAEFDGDIDRLVNRAF